MVGVASLILRGAVYNHSYTRLTNGATTIDNARQATTSAKHVGEEPMQQDG